jgi:hypothetical protein
MTTKWDGQLASLAQSRERAVIQCTQAEKPALVAAAEAYAQRHGLHVDPDTAPLDGVRLRFTVRGRGDNPWHDR